MRPLYLFYLLVIYVLLQFCWWAYLLVQLNNEVYEHRIENVLLKAPDAASANAAQKSLENKLYQRRWMITGEGTVFYRAAGPRRRLYLPVFQEGI
jgi:hypothetical protein